MVPLLLFLILLVIAWPVFAIFGGTLLLILGSHLHIIVPTVLISIAYIAFLAPIAKRNNIKLGGKMGEALDPSKPTGPEFQRLMQEQGETPPVKVGLFNYPDQWKPAPRNPDHKAQNGQTSVKDRPNGPMLAVVLAGLVFAIAVPSTVILLDQGAELARAYGLLQASPSRVAMASPTIASTGRWFVQSGQSATLDAVSGTNYLGQPISLSAQCVGGVLGLKFHFHDYLGGDEGSRHEDFKTVILRVGSEVSQELKMALGPDKTTLLADGKSREIIEKFRGEAGLMVYTHPYNSEPVTASFDTIGARAALSSILDACPPPKAYTLPEKATVSFHGDGGMIRVLKTGDEFPFTRTSPPGVELLYGDCRMAVGQYCEVGLTLNGNNLARIWSARVPVGSP